MDLSEQEELFLEAQGLTADDVLDARGLTSRDRKQIAKEQGKILILGVPCRRAGHRLRTRAGHCVQCDTSKIAFESRYSDMGYVYIAGSLRKKLIKVGGTISIDERESTLRSQGYAGTYDWRIIYSLEVTNYGRIERQVQDLLAEFTTYPSYFKDGKLQDATEVFNCSFSDALNALDEILRCASLSIEHGTIFQLSEDYEFS